MAQDDKKPAGPDLSKGIPSGDLAPGKMLTGVVGDEEVLLVRTPKGISAISTHCTHYHGPLAEGLVVGETVRCPWHHACFDLKSGDAVGAPALNPIASYEVQR